MVSGLSRAHFRVQAIVARALVNHNRRHRAALKSTLDQTKSELDALSADKSQLHDELARTSDSAKLAASNAERLHEMLQAEQQHRLAATSSAGASIY